MKKILLLVIMFLSSFLFLGCKEENLETIKVIVPSGTPLVAIGGVLGNEKYEVDVVSGADLLTAALLQKEYDVVIAPITAASKLYILRGIEYKFASIITTGNNYLVSKNGSSDISSLSGKKILAYGANNTPDIVLRSALSKYQVNCEIDYQAAVSDITPFIKNEKSEYDYFLTAEPALTQLKLKFGLDLTVIDLQSTLESEIEMIPQAGIFVLNNGKEKGINKFLSDVKNNIKDLNENSDKYYEKVSNYDEYFTKLGEDILESSLKTSNIKYYNAKDSKETMNKYYDLLNKYNNALLNGKVPNEKFYY